MLCEKCKQNEACYHSTLIVNGAKTSTNLCADCARKEGLMKDETKDFFDNIFDNFNSFFNMNGLDDFICPTCQTNFNEYRLNNFLGCPDCFSNFKKDLLDILEEKNNKIDDEKIEFCTPKKTKEEKQLDDLQSQLASAIKDERYEDAGEINKKIKELKNKIKK